MIIHSIVPGELIFHDDALTNSTQQCSWNGIPLQVEKEGDAYRVVRVLSTDPADFLNSGVQPGAYLSGNTIVFE